MLSRPLPYRAARAPADAHHAGDVIAGLALGAALATLFFLQACCPASAPPKPQQAAEAAVEMPHLLHRDSTGTGSAIAERPLAGAPHP
jgi:hypothetical protein